MTGTVPLTGKLRRCFAVLVFLLMCLMVVRWFMHGAAGCWILALLSTQGLLAIAASLSEGSRIDAVDAAYIGYFGLMACAGGFLDTHVALHQTLNGHHDHGDWSHVHHRGAAPQQAPLGFPDLIVLLTSAAVQLAAALVACLLYRELEEDSPETDPFITGLERAENARLYNAVLNYGRRPASAARPTQNPLPLGGQPPVKAFAGVAHKLPP